MACKLAHAAACSGLDLALRQSAGTCQLLQRLWRSELLEQQPPASVAEPSRVILV